MNGKRTPLAAANEEILCSLTIFEARSRNAMRLAALPTGWSWRNLVFVDADDLPKFLAGVATARAHFTDPRECRSIWSRGVYGAKVPGSKKILLWRDL